MRAGSQCEKRRGDGGPVENGRNAGEALGKHGCARSPSELRKSLLDDPGQAIARAPHRRPGHRRAHWGLGAGQEMTSQLAWRKALPWCRGQGSRAIDARESGLCGRPAGRKRRADQGCDMGRCKRMQGCRQRMGLCHRQADGRQRQCRGQAHRAIERVLTWRLGLALVVKNHHGDGSAAGADELHGLGVHEGRSARNTQRQQEPRQGEALPE